MSHHVFEITVYADEVDSFGIVHHANFLKYFERARQDWLFFLDFKFQDLIQQDVLFVVNHAELDYFLPAKIYDNLVVISRVISRRKVAIVYEQVIHGQSDPNKIYCRGIIQVVCVNKLLRPRPFPKELMERIK